MGYGVDYSPNALNDLTSGISLVGKNAVVPSGVKVGRNCIVASDARDTDFPAQWCPAARRSVTCRLGRTTMNKIYLSLALHNHQPVGNFDFVIEDAYQKAYEPMLTALERHPGVRLALHYSGPLRDWLKAHHPDFLQRVRVLVGRQQVEILTGGHYEPVLVALPDADKQGQIAKLTDTIRAVWHPTDRGVAGRARVGTAFAQSLERSGRAIHHRRRYAFSICGAGR